MFGYLIVLFAFALGFVLVRASTCSVAATKRLVRRRKPDWLIGIMIAAGCSGATLILLRMGLADQFVGPTSAPIDLVLVLASVVMGLGAYLNNGCFIGTVGRISGGDASYVFTFVGLVVARALVEFGVFDIVPTRTTAGMGLPILMAGRWALLALTAVLVIYGLYLAFWRKQPAITALGLMGIFAALTYTSDPGWSYEALVGNITAGKGSTEGFLLELSVLALFTGAILSSIQQQNFQWQNPQILRATLCFSGGALMGLGAKFVPGGNDTLLLWVIPNLILHGAVAFGIMLVTVAVLELAKMAVERARKTA